jgi:type IV pilus assembly protein PilO
MSSTLTSSKFDIFLTEKYIPIAKNKKVLIFSSLLIIPLLLFYLLLIQPAQDEIAALQKQVQTSSDELNKVRKAARELPKHEQDFLKAKEIFELTSVLLPKSQEIPDLLRNISDLGRQSGLDFLSFIPGVETPKDFYAEIPLDIKIRGPYHNLGLFLDKISKLERIVTVNNVKTEKVDLEGNEILLTSSCKLLTYRFTNVKLEPPKNK